MDKKFVEDASYCLGWDVGQNLKRNGIDNLDTSAFSEGLKAASEGADSKFSEDQVKEILNTFFTDLQNKAGETNKKQGEAFLADNAKREEVNVLPSGLQYEVLSEGSGKKPGPTDQVTTHYHGTLVDGTVFDSSVQRGEPATFPVNGVIPGWVEALQLMPEGSKWRLYVPSDLAYGGQAAGSIAPHSTLIFDVELINVN